ncbi:MAG: hypothetical protein IT249_05670 [Chitinophagaceae bacterium]|nr:hypothetical protein [Chitinophagaceae bacterium]
MLIFYPAVIKEDVYIISVAPAGQGYKIYVIGRAFGLLSIWVLGYTGVIPQISPEQAGLPPTDQYVLDEVNLFIVEHFQEFMTEA